jgi:outer membrane protein insertion porin family
MSKLKSLPEWLIVLFKRTFAFTLLLVGQQVYALAPFTIKDIRVEGIQRTEAGTVFSYLPVRVGEVFDDEKSAVAIRSLYATGFFKDVRIEAEGDILVVIVEERPSIAGVDFTGTREFEKDVLIKSLKELGLGEARIYDKALVDKALQELKRQYLSRGYYGVVIVPTITPIERNRVNVSFAVEEGEVARIKKINLVGNKAYSDSELRALLNLSSTGWFSWYTKADQYSKQKLSGDVETLRSFYLNRGYIEMQVESTQVSISADKRDIYITVNINEGEKYTVSSVKLQGQMFGRDDEFASLVSLKVGDVYSGEKLTDSAKKIAERMGNFGYAFANVNPNPDIDRQKKEVALTILIDPGKRVYVRRINLVGNNKTRDEVIRRELRQFESSWYDGEKIRLSRDRVDRLGYFKDVTIETPEVSGTLDQVDVNMTVVEKPTGNLMLGAGFSSTDKLTLTGSIQQDNAFGTGNTIGLDINTSKRNRTIALSQTNPYFTDDGISRTYEVFHRTTRPAESATYDYRVLTSGASIRFGVPFSEVDRVYFGVGAERTEVNTFSSSPAQWLDFAAQHGNGVNAAVTTFPLTVAWQRDNRDSSLVPTRGRYQRANAEISALGTLGYYRFVYQDQYFYPLTRLMTLALNGELGYGRGLGGKTYPIYKNFYAGGIGSVRGFEGATLGGGF